MWATFKHPSQANASISVLMLTASNLWIDPKGLASHFAVTDILIRSISCFTLCKLAVRGEVVEPGKL